jgi:hypothetical protein
VGEEVFDEILIILDVRTGIPKNLFTGLALLGELSIEYKSRYRL